MGAGFFFVTTGLVVAGYMGYRKLQKIETEIRQEIRSRDLPGEATPTESSGRPDLDLEDVLLGEIRRRPGILQTQLYSLVGEASRREVQALLLDMDRQGRVRREKEGSSYRLFAA